MFPIPTSRITVGISRPIIMKAIPSPGPSIEKRLSSIIGCSRFSSVVVETRRSSYL
jgi:hypothetical protein